MTTYMDINKISQTDLLGKLNAIGIALSAEKNHDRLLELIVDQTKQMTNADGGTLYTVTEDNRLMFEIMHTDSLNIRLGGSSGKPIPFYPVRLYEEDGTPNNHNVAACAVLNQQTINIPDAYASEDFDFSGTRSFDQKTGYRSKSFLTVPMTNHENQIIGAIQLINASDPETGEVIAFSNLEQQLVESLASQAAVIISNKLLINAQQQLFDSLIKLIADAIDEKSPYTAGHCRRVPILTKMLANAACKIDFGPLKDFDMTDEEKYELEVAAWLHDCGKITTPEYVVDKGTKLETIFDRIHLIDTRFEVLKRDAEIAALKRRLAALGEAEAALDDEYDQVDRQLEADRDFIRSCNVGGESISDEDLRHVDRIARYQWRTPQGGTENFLSAEETGNLKIGRGTLTVREREVINNHVTVTIKMLEALPYPEHLKRVPEYAGGHHEKMDGTGYPNKLKREDMSIPARILAIADVFEALTARDRPYKKAMTLSKSLNILGRMKLENHVDPDLFDVFMWDRIYEKYANVHLAAEQIDEVDLNTIPGYVSPVGS